MAGAATSAPGRTAGAWPACSRAMGAASSWGRHEDPDLQRRRDSRPRPRRARRSLQRAGAGHRRGARPRAERHVALAHAPPAAPGHAAPGRRVSTGRHAHRLRHAGARGVDAGETGLRDLGDQPRTEHGGGRVLFGHGGRRHGGSRGRGAEHRGVVRWSGPRPAGHPQAGPDRAAASHHAGQRLPQGDAPQYQSARHPGRPGEGRQGHAPRQPRVQRRDRSHEGSVGEGDLLDRRRPHHLDGRHRVGFPRHGRRLHLGDAAPHGHDELQAHRGRALVAGRRLSPSGDSYAGYRARLVETLRARGIRDLAVLKAFAETPRHLFVPQAVGHRAYEDTALPIGNGQTISQPFTQACYLEALRLKGRERVLEIGTGSGYQTALLGALTGTVFSVERVEALALAARQALREAGIANVSVLLGDGTLGWSAYAPYDAILVAAGGPEVPPPLVEQVAPGGRLLVPLGERGGAQTLTLVEREGEGEGEGKGGALRATPLGAARFVPLVGEHGFDA